MAVKKKNEKVTTEKVVEDNTDSNVVSEETVANEEPTKEEKYNELNDRILRLYAEFENYRKRTNKENRAEKIDGKPEPKAKIEKKIAETINEWLIPSFIRNCPETIAPTEQPNSALPNTQPIIAESKSKCLLK